MNAVEFPGAAMLLAEYRDRRLSSEKKDGDRAMFRCFFSAVVLACSSWMLQPASAEPVNTNSTASPLQSANRTVKDKWALIIGISQFKDNSLNLRFPAKDATDFYHYLITEGNFAKDHVRVLLNQQATRENILDELGDKWLPRVAMPDDLVVIYLSTHGSPSEVDIGNVNYLIAFDTNKEKLYSTGIAMQDLCRIVKARIHSERTVIVLDACHSGATNPDGKGITRTGNANAEEIAQGTGQMVICSSQPSETSWESKSTDNSVFTRRLLEALRLKGSQTTLGEAFDFLKDKVRQDVLRERGQMQTPVLKSCWEGTDLRMALKPVEPREGLTSPATQQQPAHALPGASDVQRSSGTSRSTIGESSSKPSPNRTGPVTSSTSVAPTATSLVTPATVSHPSSPDGSRSTTDAFQAEKALRDHFVRMAYSSPAEAYNDFTEAIKKVTPLSRYQVNMRIQKYVPAVANMPAEAFKHVSCNGREASILVNEKWITGLNILWKYSLLKQNGVWLISGFRKITQAEWNAM